jgi:RsiW-degrading membrane proteinase PrsW (M82 family)
MVSIWWVAWAFLVGGFAGMLVVALAVMMAREGERAVKADEAVQRDGLRPVSLDENWSS